MNISANSENAFGDQSRDDSDNLTRVRNSFAVLTAYATHKVFPNAFLGAVQKTDAGFSIDVLNDQTSLKEVDLALIQEEMKRAASSGLPFVITNMPKSEAVALFRKMSQPYKMKLVERSSAEDISIVQIGGYYDIAPGLMSRSAKDLKHFKLMSLAGAYWDGNAANESMQRIQVTAWTTKAALDSHLSWLDEVKERDHRKLGEKLGIFATMPFSPGSPVLLPKGVIIFEEMSRFIRDTVVANDYQQVRGPIMCHQSLWEKSGHWEHYKDDMFLIEGEKGDQYGLKAMNCPVHMSIFDMKPRSYKELPFRLHDQSPLHRNEASGALSGLTRLRMFSQDDSHIFIPPSEIGNEISRILRLVDHVYTVFGMDYEIKLSTKPDHALGTQEEWDLAEGALIEALEKNNKPYVVNPKDGAFYGPKIDFGVKDALGRNWQVATAQLDFQMPKRFGLKYTTEEGDQKQPVVIHNAVFGAIERFLGIAIESYNGRFPAWLSPEQVRVLPVSDRHMAWADEVKKAFRAAGMRVGLDQSGERLGKKIALSQEDRIPVVAIIGEKEVDSKSVTLRFNHETQASLQPQKVSALDDATKQLLEYTQRPPIIAL